MEGLCYVVLEEQEGAHIRGNFEVCRRSKIVNWYARLERAMMLKEAGVGGVLVSRELEPQDSGVNLLP